MASDASEIEALCRRSDKAWNIADLHHSALREAYKWFMPRRWNDMNAAGKEGNAVSSAYDHLYDHTGVQSLEDAASQIAEAMHPWDQNWSRWSPKANVREDDREGVAEAAEDFTDVCTSLINASNFDSQAVAHHKEFLIGTGFLLADKDPWHEGRIRFTASPAWQWAIEADASGRIQAMFRRMKIRARDIESTIPGGTWSDDARGKQKDAPDQEIDVEMAVYWVLDDRRWHTCYFEKATKHEVWRWAERTSPVIVTRASPSAGMAWGDGPALRALPAVKVANKIVELVLMNAAIAVTGIWQADDDGVLNPANVRLKPGAIIPKAVGSAGLTPLEAPGRFDVSQLVLEDMRVEIRRTFYVTRIEEREMSATEYSGRQQQQLREQRGLYGQLKEFLDAVMNRVVDLGEQMGVIQASNITALTQVELTGPLAVDVRALAVDRFKQTVRDYQEIFGPELAVAMVKIEKAAPWLAQQRQSELDLTRPEGELKKLADEINKRLVEQVAGPADPMADPNAAAAMGMAA